ncbi:MAG: sulfur carrier protein ThiS [Acidobacteria bacterium]|nr:sulfur carrier protein ThiS [Acidobacteriota bacterium]
MQIIINGEPQHVAATTSVTALVAQLELTAQRLAIELNRDILPRGQWPETTLCEGDQLEIVHFVGGG